MVRLLMVCVIGLFMVGCTYGSLQVTSASGYEDSHYIWCDERRDCIVEAARVCPNGYHTVDYSTVTVTSNEERGVLSTNESAELVTTYQQFASNGETVVECIVGDKPVLKKRKRKSRSFFVH